MTTISSGSNYQGPSWNQWTGTGNKFLDFLLVVVGLPVGFALLGIGVLALLIAANLTMGAGSLLVSMVTTGATQDVLEHLLLSGIAGVFAGVAVTLLRMHAGRAGRSLFSALFSKGLGFSDFNALFFGRLAIGAVSGWVMGAVSGSCGAISFTELASSTATAVLHTTAYPLSALLSRSSGGGLGGGREGFEFWLMFVILLIGIVLTIVVLCIVSGFVLQVLLCGLAGVFKGGAKEFTILMLDEAPIGSSYLDAAPIRAAMIRGALTGLFAGVLMAGCTAWGILTFFQ